MFRRFSQQGFEVFKVENTLMNRQEIRREFKNLEAKGLVTVRRSLAGNPVYVELSWRRASNRAEWGSNVSRSRMITQQVGKRFINAQAWAISEARREIRKRFQESNQ